MDTFYLALADKYGNVVADDDASSLSVSINFDDVDSDSSYPPFLGGSTTFSSSGGIFSV